jgi:pyruvate/2-oxoglutarate/acetoin dehydrogenase E1 component
MSTEQRMITFRDAIFEALDEAMAADERVIVFGEDVGEAEGGGVFKATLGLGPKHGHGRVRSTPISEQAIVGAGIGAAIAGLRPVAEVMLMNFLSVAMDQIANHAAKIRFMSGGQTAVPLTIRTVTGAGGSFGAQHSEMLEAWFAHVPGLKVVVPSTPADAKGLLAACIDDDDPCLIVEHSGLYFSGGKELAPPAGYRVPIGRSVCRREGTDITLISYGRMMVETLSAAAALADEGVSAEVLDLRTVSPLDTPGILASVAKTTRAVVVHESVGPFGVGAEVAARIHKELFGDLSAPVERVSPPFTPVPFSAPLEQAYLPNADLIADAVRRLAKS